MRVAARWLCGGLSALAVAVSSPAPAAAQAPGAGSIGPFEKLDVNEDGLLSGTEMKSVSAMDADGDGRVSRAEYDAGKAKLGGSAADDEKRFAELDKNEDGFLSGNEKTNVDKYDADRDGEISKREYLDGRKAERPDPNDEAYKKARAAVEEALRQRAVAIFKIQDANSDGRLSGTEIAREFAKFDADRNSRVTLEEYLAGVLAEQLPKSDPAAPAPPAPPRTGLTPPPGSDGVPPPVAPHAAPPPPSTPGLPNPTAPLENAGPAKPVVRDGAAAATQATADYVKAFNAGDIDGLMAITGRPWLNDVARVIKDRTELREHFEKAVKGPPLKTEVIKADKFGGIRGQVNSPTVLALFDQVLTPDDYVVSVGTGGVTYSAAFVKIVDGRAVVVGWTR